MFDKDYYNTHTSDNIDCSDEATAVQANLMASWHHVEIRDIDPKHIQPYSGFRPIRVICKTLDVTTQQSKMVISLPFHRHLQPVWDLSQCEMS